MKIVITTGVLTLKLRLVNKASFLLTFILVIITGSLHAYDQTDPPYDASEVNTIIRRLSYRDPDSALNMVHKYLAIADSAKWFEGMSSMRENLPAIFAQTGNSELRAKVILENQRLFQQWMASIDKAHLKKLQVRYAWTFFDLANMMLDQGNYDSVLVLSNIALNKLQIIDLESKNVKARINRVNEVLGAVLYYQGNVDSAIQIFIKAQKIKEEIDNPQSIVGGYSNIGNMYLSKGNLSEALSQFQLALNLSQEHELISLEGSILGNIGQVYHQQHEFEKALKYSLRAVRMAEVTNENPDVAFYSSHVGDAYASLKKPDSALFFYQKSLVLNREMNAYDDQAYIMAKISDLLIDKGNWQEALTRVQSGLEIIGQDNFEEKLLLQARQIKCLIALGKKQEALRVANALSALIQQTDNVPYQSEAYGAIHQAMEVNGRYRQGYEALVKFKSAQDSLNREEKALELARVEYNYELQREQELANVEQERQAILVNQTLQRQRWIQYVAFGSTIFIAFIIAILFRAYRIKQKSNRQLLEKNEEITQLRDSEKKMAEETIALKERELSTITMLSHEKNTLLEQLNTQIGDLSTKVDEDIVPELKGIRKIISTNLNEESWSVFTYHFEKVHPKFFQALKSNFTSLTQNDLRLCAYVRVGMSNKEIANISNITADAVKKSLQRMKKKMSLTVQTDLRDFLMTV